MPFMHLNLSDGNNVTGVTIRRMLCYWFSLLLYQTTSTWGICPVPWGMDSCPKDKPSPAPCLSILGCIDKADDWKVIFLAIILDFDILLVAWGPHGVTGKPPYWSINYSWLNIRLHHPKDA
jgi:hypothetical protein